MKNIIVTMMLAVLSAEVLAGRHGPWTKEKAWEWYDAQPWIRGCNYMPASCANHIDLWQEYGSEARFEEMEREMALMEKDGFNAVRLLLGDYGLAVWRAEHDGMMKRFERMLEIFDRHGVRVILIFGNDCSRPKSLWSLPPMGEQKWDLGYHAGRRQSQHGSFPDEPGYTVVDDPGLCEEFFAMCEEFLTKYAHDRRILFWNLWNEPGANNRGNISPPHIRRLFELAWKIDPDQPLAADLYTTEAGWTNNAAQSVGLELNDIISYHCYQNLENQIGLARTIRKRLGRPMVNTEWLGRVFHCNLQDIYPFFAQSRIGCTMWGYVNGKYQTHEPWEGTWRRAEEDAQFAEEVDVTRWFHDLYRPSLRPYDPVEIDIIRHVNAEMDAEYRAKIKGEGEGSLRVKIAKSHKITGEDMWHGCRRTTFDFNGRTAWIVEPSVAPAKGMPWTWTMQWAEAFVDRTGVPDLLKRGFHHATIELFDTRMDEKGIEMAADFQKFLVDDLGFAQKANLIGMSWGGFFATRYAAVHSENVAKIYYDAPLMNFNGFGNPDYGRIGVWADRKPADGDWSNDPEMPVNMAEKIAAAKIPVLLVYGGADTVVPPTENCEVFAHRFKAAGGDLTIDRRPLFGHHPHGLDPDKVKPIVDFFGVSGACAVDAPRPSEAQMKYFEADVIGIVHYGLNTYVDKEWGYGDTPTSVFQPTNLDPEQWVVAAKAGGLKRLVLVCKHHDGFCLFPSKLNDDYTVANTSWKGGKGDLVREFRDACTKHGMEFGAYLSPWDRHQANYASSAYADYFQGQWDELLAGYGPISEIWLDGANGGDGWYGGAKETRKLPSDARAYYRFDELLDKLEKQYPNAIAFGGGLRPNCAKWCGNEVGMNPETSWNAEGGAYIPNEADTPFRRRGWFWHPDDQPKSLAELIDIYFMTVGRNSVLDLGLAPNRDGVIGADDVARLKEFGEYVRAFNATDFAVDARRADTREGNRLTVNLKLPTAKTFNAIDLKEEIAEGQYVGKWTVEAKVGGSWMKLAAGTTIGYRRMERFGSVEADEVRIVLEGEVGTPLLKSAALRFAPPVKPEPQAQDFEQWRSPVKLSEPSPDVRIYDLLRRVAVDTFQCRPPKDRTDGVPDKFAIYASDDGENWHEILKGEFGNLRANPVMQRVSMPEKVETRYLKLVALHALDGTPRWEGVLTEFFRGKPVGSAKPEELVDCPVSDNLRGHENVEWSRAYAFSLTDDKRDLPRVFLVGDSICNGYQEKVRELLDGKMNVSYWISSYCVTSPGYLRLLDFYLDEAKYDVVHFNNGLHSLQTAEKDYEKGLRAALAMIRAKQPGAKIIWATSTPLKDPEKTEKAKRLNAVAAKVISEFEDIEVDDLFSEMDPLDRETNWGDTYHFVPEVQASQAKIVVRSIECAGSLR